LIGDLRKVEGDNIKGKGQYGGKILSKLEIDDWAKMIFNKYGTKLELVDDFGDPGILAQFDAVTNTIRHKKDVTQYLLFHETMHAEECFTLGKLKYLEDAHIVNTPVTDANLLRTYKREKYVYDKIKPHAKEQEFIFDEIDHAELYIEWIELKLKTRGISIPK
jgi:hypothetical protein